MRISVFGIGYVGVVSCGCLVELGHEVIGVDLSADKITALGSGRSPIVEEGVNTLIARAVHQGRLTATNDAVAAVVGTDVSFISVGTPSAADGSVAMEALDNVISAIGAAIRKKTDPHVVVMRSTIPPGSGEDRFIPMLEKISRRSVGDGLRYYSNPEFLREGSSVRDFAAPPFTLIGAPRGDDAVILRDIYSAIDAPIHVTPIRIAESVKHISNVFHAVKLTFANEAGAILAAHGVDAREALRLLCEDRMLNISPAYLRPGFAFGGSCLPKDIRSFLSLANQKNLVTPMLKNILSANSAIIERTFDAISRHGRHPVAMFGLAFKQGTDDLRESPFVLLAEKLLGKGYNVRIYDRFVQFATLMGSNRAYIDREIPHLEQLMVASPAAALAGAKIAIIGHIAPEDHPALWAGLDGHIVIDLVGFPDLSVLPGYEGLCW